MMSYNHTYLILLFAAYCGRCYNFLTHATKLCVNFGGGAADIDLVSTLPSELRELSEMKKLVLSKYSIRSMV